MRSRLLFGVTLGLLLAPVTGSADAHGATVPDEPRLDGVTAAEEARVGTIRGRVIDAQSGQPLATAQVVVVAAALPVGVNPYLIATRFGTGQELASNTMTVSTALAAFTTGFWLLVAQWVFV